MEAVLQTKNLSKRFKGRWAVRDLNIEVFRGDVFSFLGPNGAGKSTTIRMILTLLMPSSGSIEIFGEDLHHNRGAVLARVCGIVEKPDFYLYLSAYKNLEILGSMTRGVQRREIMEVLDLVGLAPRAFDKVRTYSHGMKQRLGIAQALLTKPELIILDEPTTGFDPQGMKEVREMIRTLSTERKMTIFLSTHLLSEVEQVATRMAVINHGELIAQGSVSDLLDRETTHYSIQVVPNAPALDLIERLPWVELISHDNNRLEVRIAEGRASELNRLFISNGIEVSSIFPHKTLEDFFLKVTRGKAAI
ncbi:Bacitracin transport ATP-binding protein BcrA [uncultured Desulfobacterium sp.]|uniref:Bacitracin transport ATP-binding protein BcrA n=1 Tax=uncultured Desulfobacterium sp. TaxID=201089 RepID=A0A445MZT3_9BACT|nr:Bacitracin transport ATP-binding protein BcrA [uncultured Desulfobacterium sp.]